MLTVAVYAIYAAMTNEIKKYRTENDLSLEAFGLKFKANKTTVMRWEKGRVPAERVHEVSKKTGIPKEKLRADLFGKRA